MICNICGHQVEYLFKGEVLKKYSVGYFLCKNCFHIQTEEPFWMNEAYVDPINENDAGIMGRNINFANRLAPLLMCECNKTGTYLDWAGGYDIFVRLMRDIGFDFKWADPYAKNLFAHGAEMADEEKFDLITCFEVFEHLEHPLEHFEKLFSLTDRVLISTELFDSKNIPKQNEWYYYAPMHGQHISFYSIETLRFIGRKYNMDLLSNNFNLHFFSRKKIKHRFMDKFFLMAHRLLLIPFTEYVKVIMKPKTLEDSKLFDKQER
jgi:hypothetical protein